MKITLLLNGKTTIDYLSRGIEDYLTRLKHYVQLEVVVIPEVKSVKGLTTATQMEREADQMLKRITPADHVVLLDEHGREPRSLELAAWLEKRQASSQRIVFIVGGPYGFSPRIKQRANELMSLSRLTFSHQMIRLLFVEQLYRAYTIIKGEPYHHE